MERYSRVEKKSWQYDEREINKFLSQWFNRKISDISKYEIKSLHLKIRENNGLYQAIRTGHENEGDSWSPVQAWAVQLRKQGVAVVFIHHANKEGKQRGNVLPPSRPAYNGGVERGNRTFKEEFYYRCDLLADSIGAMRFELKKALKKYNTYRPHKSLGGLTPLAYIQNTCSGD